MDNVGTTSTNPSSQERNNIIALQKRAFIISSSEDEETSKLNKVKRDLKYNDYPHCYIEKCESVTAKPYLPEDT